MSRAPDAVDPALRILATAALREDIGTGDVTTLATVGESAQARGRIRAGVRGVLSGLEVARGVFLTVDPGLRVEAARAAGESFEEHDVVMRVAGSARAILIGERTALNFLARLSGIATLTAAFVERVAGTSARILDTRKTTPGLRFLEKAAVRDGGGCNHRGGLFDALMIKDNHIAAAGGLAEALRGAREYRTRHVATLPLIVEVRTVADALLAARSGATRVLLDNFQPADVARAVAAVRALPEGVALEIEVSGGVTLDNVRDFALPGVDFISVGALTHSAPGIDFSLDLEATGEEL